MRSIVVNVRGACYTGENIDIDFRDSETVWLHLADDVKVELSRDFVRDLLPGFDDNSSETYPRTNRFKRWAEAELLKAPELRKLALHIADSVVGEYEHGSADLEEITLDQYIGVLQDLFLTLKWDEEEKVKNELYKEPTS